MRVRKKHILTVLLLGTLGVNIPILAAVGQWSVSGNNMYYIDGSVGIGKDVPSSPLHIQKSSVIDTAQRVELEGSLSGADWEAIRINANANFSNSNSISWEFDSINGATGPAISAYRTSGTDTDLTLSATKNDLRNEIIRLKGATGNVGIGNNAPGAKLDVKGNNNLGNSPNVVAAFRANNHAGVIIGSLNGNTPYIGDDPGASSSVGLSFFTNGQERMRIKNDNGNIGIGTTNPKHKLSVNGTILAKEVIVSIAGSNWPDYVFEDGYKLSPLSEVENYIKENNHLPNIPSAKEVEEKGISLGEMQKMQMAKIEELTLYIIELEVRINKLENGDNKFNY